MRRLSPGELWHADPRNDRAMTVDERFMARAIEVAAGARGLAEPNPLVGCVIVRDCEVVGEGHTSRYGGPHAEPAALDAAGARAVGATAYVTLEPCCYTGHGKLTPPCAPRLIGARLARVVIGCADPNPHVAGNGVRQLREAGLDVTVGVLEARARQLIAPFVARVLHNRPYVTLKWAVSADGKVAGRQGRPVRITNAAATAAVHWLRGRVDAIAVGTNTLVNDDPLLTARTPEPLRVPTRVVFSNSFALDAATEVAGSDQHPRLPSRRHGKSRLFSTPDAGPVLVYTVDRGMALPTPAKVEVVALPPHDNGRGGVRFSMADAFADLAQRRVAHLLIEPGPKLARELIARNQADRVWTIRGQHSIGDDGLDALDDPYPTTATLDLDGDLLRESLNPRSAAYFGNFPSPDIVRFRSS